LPLTPPWCFGAASFSSVAACMRPVGTLPSQYPAPGHSVSVALNTIVVIVPPSTDIL
jgi:hypothetical protein